MTDVLPVRANLVRRLRIHLEARRAPGCDLPVRKRAAHRADPSPVARSTRPDAALPHRRRRAVRLLCRQCRMCLPSGAGLAAAGENVLDLSPVFRCISTAAMPPEGKGLLGAWPFRRQTRSARSARTPCATASCKGGRSARRSANQILDYCMTDIDALAAVAAEAVAARSTWTSRCTGESSPRCRRRWSTAAFRSTWRYFRSCRTSEPGRSSAMPWCPRSTHNTASMSKARTATGISTSQRFEDYLARAGIDWPRHEIRQAQPAPQDLRQHGQGVAGARGTAPAAPRPRQDATDQAGGRSRRPQSNRAVAVSVEDIAHATEGLAVDFLAGGLAALTDQARARARDRLYRLVLDGIPDCGALLANASRCSSCTPPAVRTSSLPSASTRPRPTATKKTHAHVHERYKVGCLGAQYGMQTETLAQRLGVSTFVATRCSASIAGCSISTGRGWKTGSRTRSTPASCAPLSAGPAAPASPNSTRRSIGNWPVQATGADILRLACIWAHRRGIELCGSVHDAVLIEAPIERIDADVALMQEIMRRASRVVLNGCDGPTSFGPTPPSCAIPIATATSAARRSGRTCSTCSRNTEQQRKRRPPCQIDSEAG